MRLPYPLQRRMSCFDQNIFQIISFGPEEKMRCAMDKVRLSCHPSVLQQVVIDKTYSDPLLALRHYSASRRPQSWYLFFVYQIPHGSVHGMSLYY